HCARIPLTRTGARRYSLSGFPYSQGESMHRNSWLVGLAAAGAVLVLNACGPTYPKCDSDENCKDHNEVCVQGQCRECATDQNCKAGFVCTQNACVPKPECTDDAACGAGRKCDNGKCVAKGCAQDNDCGPNA